MNHDDPTTIPRSVAFLDALYDRVLTSRLASAFALAFLTLAGHITFGLAADTGGLIFMGLLCVICIAFGAFVTVMFIADVNE